MLGTCGPFYETQWHNFGSFKCQGGGQNRHEERGSIDEEFRYF